MKKPSGTLDKELLDFRNFLYLAFKELGLPHPTKRQYEIAHFLQTGPRRLQVSGFRGVGKSIIAEIFCVWCYFLVYSNRRIRPEYAVKSLSAGGKRAVNFSTFIQNLIRRWALVKHLTPRENSRSSVWNWDVGVAPIQDSPSMAALGVGGQLTGGRADLCVLDDVETPENSYSVLLRERLSDTVREVDALLKPIKEEELRARFPHLPFDVVQQITGRVVVLGTPQTEETVYNELEKRGYVKRIWPARYPSQKWLAANSKSLAPTILKEIQEDPSLAQGWGIGQESGKPTDTRFTDEDLIERELSLGRTGFALQYMLDATLSDLDQFPLKLRDLVVLEFEDRGPDTLTWCSAPDKAVKDVVMVGLSGDRYFYPLQVGDSWTPFQGTVMAIDPSGKGRDETALAVVSALHSRLFVHEVFGFGPGRGFESEVLETIAKKAAQHSVNLILVEDIFGHGMFGELLAPYLRRYHPCPIEPIKGHGKQSKEERIISVLEPVMNQHRLVVHKEVITQDGLSDEKISLLGDTYLYYSLFWQMTRIKRVKNALPHDDRLDALAMAVEYWADSMGLDPEIEAQRQRELEHEKFLEQQLQGIYSKNKSRNPNFLGPLRP